MDFLVCKCGIQGLEIHIALENIKDKDEAVSKAKEIALHTKYGATVGLFTRDADAICGWKVMKDGKLRNEPADMIQYTCGVGPGSFESSKRQAEERRKSRDSK